MFWQQIPSEIITDILSEGCMEGVVLDLEHGFFNNERLYNCIQIINSKSKYSFIRVKNVDKNIIGFALDSGCCGIILANFDSEIKYNDYLSSIYNRGIGFSKVNQWGSLSLKQEKPIIAVQIESVNGIRFIQNNKTIFDYYILGEYDLSNSCGCCGDFETVKYLDQVNIFNDVVPKEKRGIHIVKNIKERIDKYKDYGFIAYSLDTNMLIESIEKIKNEIISYYVPFRNS